VKTTDVEIGSIYAMFSRGVLVVCGFLVHIVLARRLGPELFGLYTLVLSILVWVESSVSVGISSVFRKIISENKSKIRPIFTTLKKLSVPFCLMITVIFALLSTLTANVMHDDRLIFLLIIASLDIPFFGMYSIYLGLLNGHGEFLLQSALASLYSVSRAIFIVAAVLFGFGVTGALVGNAIGSFCGLLLALHFAKKLVAIYDPETDDSMRLIRLDIRSRLVTFGIPFLAYSLLTSVLIHMDIWFVKALTVNRTAADEVVGYYAVAYNFARVPYLLMTAIIVTIFPAISKAVFENRMLDARQLIKQLLRLALLILVPLIVVVYSTADSIITLLFSSAYLPATKSLQILFAGVSAFSIFLFFVSIIAADNKPHYGLVISFFLIPVAISLNYFLIKAYGIEGAAVATSAVSCIGLVASGMYVWRRFGAFIDTNTLVRILLASGCVFIASRYEMLYRFHLIVGYAALFLVYGVSLIVLKEIDINKSKVFLQSLWKM